jgi:hypothetical protein
MAGATENSIFAHAEKGKLQFSLVNLWTTARIDQFPECPLTARQRKVVIQLHCFKVLAIL